MVTDTGATSSNWADQALDKSTGAMWIASQNISSLYTSAERHTATKADVYAWQEVEVPRDERQITKDKMKELEYAIKYGREEKCNDASDIKCKVAMAVAKGINCDLGVPRCRYGPVGGFGKMVRKDG